MPTTMQQYAEDYGYQLAFLKSDPELYKIFTKAVAAKWDSTRFVAAVKASKWYKTHGEAYRQNLAVKTTDPATWKQRLVGQMGVLGDLAGSMGATLTNDQMKRLAEQSILMGWNDQVLRNVVATYIKAGSSKGQAATLKQQLKETAYRNGFAFNDSTADYWVKQISMGNDTIEAVQQRFREAYGAKLAPGFEKELKAGMDLYDIASPYMQTMAQTLELNPSDIDLFDPTIRKALGSAVDEKGKPTQGATSLWQFEQQLRQDKRFMQTKQAQDQTMAVGHQVLRDMGLVGN